MVFSQMFEKLLEMNFLKREVRMGIVQNKILNWVVLVFTASQLHYASLMGWCRYSVASQQLTYVHSTPSILELTRLDLPSSWWSLCDHCDLMHQLRLHSCRCSESAETVCLHWTLWHCSSDYRWTHQYAWEVACSYIEWRTWWVNQSS